MRIWTTLVLSAVALVAASCGENAPPGSTSGAGMTLTANAPAGSPAGASASNPNADIPTPPADAQWTIRCQVYQGLTHVIDANRAKDQAIRISGSGDWYVVHEDNLSTLYYGFFRSWDDPSDATEYARARQAREMVSNLTTGDSDHPFAQCQFALINTPDPEADSSWNLLNAKGFWSLEVAAFQGFAGRKQAAVDAVKQFRAAGIPAYFYHGPAISSVCIGAWPREAVKEQDMADAQVDPDSAVMVLPDTLPKGTIIPKNLETPEGQRVEAVAPRVEVADPTLMQAMQDYPDHAVNGEVGREITTPDGKTVEKRYPSFLVQIPEKTTSFLADQSSGAGGTPPDASQNAGLLPGTAAFPDQRPQIGGPGGPGDSLGNGAVGGPAPADGGSAFGAGGGGAAPANGGSASVGGASSVGSPAVGADTTNQNPAAVASPNGANPNPNGAGNPADAPSDTGGDAGVGRLKSLGN